MKKRKHIENLFILTDLEGVSGVERFSQTREEGTEKDEAKELLTAEINAVISGICQYDENIHIHVWDGHGSGGVVKENLKPVKRFLPSQWMHQHNYFKENKIDALVFVGQHAQSLTVHGNQAHTMSSRTVHYYSINGNMIGEFGLRAAIAGELGIPTIYISGDDKACNEAKNLIPDIVTTTVMYGTGWESAVSIDPKRVHQNQTNDIQIALKMADEGIIEPFIIEPPIKLEVCKKNIFQILSFLRKGGKRKGFNKAVFEVQSMGELQDQKAI